MADILAVLPLILLITLAISTKKMGESLMAAAALAMFLLYRGNVVNGAIDTFYNVLSDSSYQFCIIFLLIFGAVMKLFQESGGLQGFAKAVQRFVRGPRTAMVFCWLMDIVLFMDEYLNSLTVGFSMRVVTDRYRIPREHLALHVNAMACSLCLAVPMTSWTAFILSLIRKNGLDFIDYVHAIPMMLYPVLMSILCLLLAAGVVPKLGMLKQAYLRVDQGGPLLLEETKGTSLVDFGEPDENNVSSCLNLLIPMAVIIAGSVWFGRNMLAGLLLGLICQFLMYLPQKQVSPADFFRHFFDGASSMLPLLMIIFFGFVLNEANQELGLYDLVIRVCGASIPSSLLPVVTFLIAGALVFATGSCWMIMLLAVPIFIPLAAAMNVDAVLTLAALMSGIGLGYSTCFYGDTIFMTAAGTGVGNVSVIRTTLPYAMILTVISTAGYVLLGIYL